MRNIFLWATRQQILAPKLRCGRNLPLCQQRREDSFTFGGKS